MMSIQKLEVKASLHESTLSEVQDSLVACEDAIEFLEKRSRRKNVKLIGIPENESEAWDEPEETFKSRVQYALTNSRGSGH